MILSEKVRWLRMLFSITVQLSILGLMLVGLSQPIWAETVTFSPVKDNTLYEHATGDRSNGKGAFLFTGRDAGRGDAIIRRALLAFDLNSIQPGAVISSATLKLHVSRVPPGVGATTVSLFRVQADWGEGSSDAPGVEGVGTQSTTGDATWLHTFFDTDLWGTQGGDIAASPSASLMVGNVGFYVLGSTIGMVADVQAWVDNPASNFGWLLKGDESTTKTARRFDSRENSAAENRPELTVDFTPPGADLALTKTVDQLEPKEGDTIAYSVTISNNGPGGTTNIEVTDLLPDGITLVSDTVFTGTYNASTGVWSIGALENAASASLSLTATVDAGTMGATIVNSASVTGSDLSDPNLVNNVATASVTVESVLRADINNDEVVDLTDAMLALQVISGLQPPGIRSDYAQSGTDVNGDGRVGPEEAVFALDVTAGLRSP